MKVGVGGSIAQPLPGQPPQGPALSPPLCGLLVPYMLVHLIGQVATGAIPVEPTSITVTHTTAILGSLMAKDFLVYGSAIVMQTTTLIRSNCLMLIHLSEGPRVGPLVMGMSTLMDYGLPMIRYQLEILPPMMIKVSHNYNFDVATRQTKAVFGKALPQSRIRRVQYGRTLLKITPHHIYVR